MQEHWRKLRRVLAWRIERRLDALGVHRSTVAAEAGCSRRTLHSVLRQEVGLRVSGLGRLASALNCTPAYLLDGNDVGPPPTCIAAHVPNLARVLACNIRGLRAGCFSTVNGLADAAGISRAQLYLIVGEHSDTSIDHVACIAAALRQSPAALVADPVPRAVTNSGILHTSVAR